MDKVKIRMHINKNHEQFTGIELTDVLYSFKREVATGKVDIHL